MTKIMALLLLVSMTGCMTAEKYHARLDKWIGRPSSDMLSVWGVPTQGFENKETGQKMYVFHQQGQTTTMVQNYGYGMTGINDSTPWCDTTFIVNSSGSITNWRATGNSCVSD